MNKNFQRVSDVNDELSLTVLISKTKETYQYLITKWILIVAFGIIGGLIGFSYAYLKKPVYRATSTFVLEEGDKSSGLGQYAGLANIAGIDLGGSGGLFQGENILELYRSRKMIRTALLASAVSKDKPVQLIELYINQKGLRKKWADEPSLQNIDFKDSSKFTVKHDSVFNDIIKEINKKVLVVSKSDKSPGIFQVEVKAEDQIFAKGFADQIVKTVNNFYIETKTKRSKENLANLQKQTDSVKAVMDGTIYSSAAILDATPNLNPTRQRLRVSMERARVGAETNKIILGELVKNLELMKMSMRREVPLIQLIDAPVYPLEKISTSKIAGFVGGAFLFAFLVTFILLVIRMFKADVNS
jgi:hypothetical protein